MLGGGACDRIGCCGRPRDIIGCEREVVGTGRERLLCVISLRVVFRESPLPRRWCVVELVMGVSDCADELRDRDAGI